MRAVECLVGRQAEISQLRRVLAEDAAPAVVVSGEPGVGKTALIDYLCAQAATDGWKVVRILGVQAEEAYALGGLNQIALGLKDFRNELDEADRAVLAPVFGADPTTEVSVLPLAAALLNLLEVAGTTQQVLVAVDDVHWLDSVSAEVLGALGRRLNHPHVRIVAGRRTPYETAFSASGWDELPLAPLNAGDSQELLDQAGVALTAAATAAVLATAAGNPLALAELPRNIGQIDDTVGTLPLTERLVGVFGGRLHDLDADMRAALLRTALDGSADTASTSRARYVILDAEAAITAGLLVVNPLGQIVFRHPLVRAAVIQQASPRERRDAHRDLAELYGDVLVRRASHLAAAATGPDQEVADLLGQAAQLSLRLGGLPAAIEWLRQAAELSTQQDRRAAFLAEAAFIATRTGRIDEARELLGNTQADATESALAVLADCYQAVHSDGEVVSTHKQLLNALSRADAIDDDMVVNRLTNLLLYVTGYGDDDQRREQTNAGLRPLQSRVAPAVLLYQTGVDDIASTATAIRSTLAGYVEFLPQLPERWVLMMSYPAYCVDAMAEFRAPLRKAFAQLCGHGVSMDAIEGGRVVMLDFMATGHWEHAAQVGADCLEMAGQIQGSELLRQTFLADLGMLAASRGDLETARRYAAEVTAWCKPRGLNMVVRTAHRIAVRVALAEADYEAAYQAAIKISPPAQFPRKNIQVGDDMLDLMEALVRTGRLKDARAHVAEAVRLNLGDVSPRVAALILAMSAMTAPDPEAGALYESALSHPGIAEFPFEHARIVLAQGMWLRRSRRHTEARAPLELANAIFERLGAHPWAERALAELRVAAVSTHQTPGAASALSAQERRIAELAANGETSKEIAAKLSLSPRTVDVHLRRTFNKLGITRRGALSKALRDFDASPENSPTV